jgi:hypothetical protein
MEKIQIRDKHPGSATTDTGYHKQIMCSAMTGCIVDVVDARGRGEQQTAPLEQPARRLVTARRRISRLAANFEPSSGTEPQ